MSIIENFNILVLFVVVFTKYNYKLNTLLRMQLSSYFKIMLFIFDVLDSFAKLTSHLMRKDGSKITASWDRHAVLTFCDLCIREIEIGNRPGIHLTRNGWRNVVAKFAMETGREYNRLQLRSKWIMLKRDWKQWKLMLENETKIKWNSRKGTIDAPNDWWEEKIKVIPEAKRFRSHGIDPELEQKLDKMFVVFGDLEEYAPVPSDTDELDQSEEHEHSRERKSLDHALSLGKSEKLELVEDPIPSEPTKRRNLAETILSPKRYKKMEVVVNPDTKPSNWIDQPPDASAKCSNVCSITEAIHLLDSIDDIPKASPLYYFAIKIILDRDKREVFMALAPETKVWWLKMEEQESRKQG